MLSSCSDDDQIDIHEIDQHYLCHLKDHLHAWFSPIVNIIQLQIYLQEINWLEYSFFSRLWDCTTCYLYSAGGWYVVVLHSHHDFILYRQPGGFPDSRTHGVAHWECRGPGQTNHNQIWIIRGRFNHGFLPGKYCDKTISIFKKKSLKLIRWKVMGKHG